MTGKKIRHRFLFIMAAGFLLLIACLGLVAAPPIAHAASCSPCTCTISETNQTMNRIREQHLQTRLFITEEFKNHQDWFFGANRYFSGGHDSFFELHVLPALMMMTEQLVATGMNQMFILGSFFDAKLQLETQQLFQKREAQAHKDYHPSFEMCTIGTAARSLAASDRNGEFTGFVLSQRAQDRQLGIYATNAAYDSSVEREGRIRQVKAHYCDPRDNAGKLDLLCSSGKADAATINRDIDYTRTVDGVRTLNIDFTDNTVTTDERDVMALASNLFSHEVLNKPARSPGATEEAEGAYLEMRSLLAKRSVVQSSFNSIIGLKAAGTAESEQTAEFTKFVLDQLGATNPDSWQLLTGTMDSGITPAEKPSYYALLEVIAQRIYQDPEFFTNLYDKPANVLRKNVAMQAINLMLERDLHKSELRSEMVLSIWLEMELMRYQNDVQNRMNSLEEIYEQN